MDLPRSIAGDRFTLRPHRMADIDDVLSYADDAEWSRFLTAPSPYGRQDAVDFLELVRALPWAEHPNWALIVEGRVSGNVNLRIADEGRSAEIGYGLARRHWGRGLATAAAGLVVDTAFATLPDLAAIQARADVANHASRRVLEKLGMRLETIRHRDYRLGDELRNNAIYGLAREAWTCHTA